MATWQQGNSGSFLAGIGSNNTNAPQASDINATLGMIRDNNDRARAGENNLGMQLANATGSIFNSWKQGQQQQRQGEFQKAYAGAYASGDRGAMRQLAAQYPEQFEAVQKGMGFIDDDHRNTIGTLATSGQLAATQGPEGFTSWLKGNASELKRVGINPGDVATMYQQNPEGFQQLAGNMAMFSLGPEKAFEVQDKMMGRDIDRSKLAETIRSNKAGEGLQAQGQNLSYSAQMARLNHDKMVYKQSQAQLARAGAAQDMDVAQLNATIASTGMDPLTGKAATGARMAQATKWNNGNNSYNDALITGERGIEKVDALLNKKSLDGVGRVQGLLPDMATSSDGLATRNTIEELKSGAFVQNVQALRGMGALSNAEGSKLENLIAKLDITQPEEVVRKQLQEIKSQYSVLQKVADREAQTMGYSSAGYDTYVSGRKAQREQEQAENSLPTYSGKPQQAAVAERAISGVSDGATATNPRTGQKLVYRGGQWQPM